MEIEEIEKLIVTWKKEARRDFRQLKRALEGEEYFWVKIFAFDLVEDMVILRFLESLKSELEDKEG